MEAKIIFAIAIAGMAIAPAQAHWQYTKWGMTRAQVEKASKGLAVPGTSSTGKPILTAPYTSGSFQFTAEFWFDDNDRLYEVALDLSQGNPHELIGALKGKYGIPENETPGMIRAWRWRSGADTVSAMMTEDKTSVFYKPSVDANGRGL